MKPFKFIPYLVIALVALVLGGCATKNDAYNDDPEYSNMPWSTPQQWEGSPTIPGLSGPGY